MQMDRRTFLGGAFGLVVVAAGAGIAAASYGGGTQAYYTTSGTAPADAPGPAMMPGISLVRDGETVRGMSDDVHLFDVDALGAELIERADGTRTLDELAETTSVAVSAADVATFFVTLGQSGYLQNTVLVNLTQTVA